MSDRDALVLTLVRGLEHAATALDVVNDATRREVGALLSPKARQLLAALTAAPTEAAAPLGDAAEAIEASDPQPKRQKASASKPTGKPVEVTGEWLKAQPKKRRHIAESSDDDNDARPRTASGLQAFPEDVLGAVISFADFPMRFSCVVACGAMHAAAAKLSPRLEHALVLRRYPLLATLPDYAPTNALVLGDLFQTYKRFFRSNRRFALPAPTVGLDAYTLSLELSVWKVVPPQEGAPQRRRYRKKSLWVGTGTLAAGDSPYRAAVYEFTVPEGLFATVDRNMSREWDLKAKVMASRRTGSGRVQIARLYQGGTDDFVDEETFIFEWDDIPYSHRNRALDWLHRTHGAHDLYVDPQLALYWDVESQKVEARFVFQTPDDRDDMSLPDACLTLEHFAEWSK